MRHRNFLTLLWTTIFIVHRSCLADDITGSENLQLWRLATAFGELQERLESLEEENKLHKHQIIEQQIKIDQQQQEMNQMRSDVFQQTSKCDKTDLLLQQLTSEIHSLTSRHKGERQLANEATVAFYGKMSGVKNISQDEIIKFNNIVTQIGHGYDPATGLFVAPVPGVYFFSVTIMVEKTLDTHLGIYVNGQRKTYIKLHGTEHEYDTMSQSAVYYLANGDNVSVRHYEGNKTLHGDYTSLTAFLLYQDYGQLTGNAPINVIG